MSTPVLGALLLSEVEEASPSRVLKQTVQLAVRLEMSGYERCWLAEHHVRVAHACPELMIAVLASATKTIRIGAAGILLSLYPPLKVADQFRLLATLYPGRVELGLAKGVPPPTRVSLFLSQEQPDLSELYNRKIGQLFQILDDSNPCAALPNTTDCPEVWVLGSSLSGAELAGKLGAAFCHGIFLSTLKDDRAAIDCYVKAFRPSVRLKSPRWSVAVAGACADANERARRVISRNTVTAVYPTVVGTPDACRERIDALRRDLATDEIVFLDLCPGYDDRARSYELLAGIYGLSTNRASESGPSKDCRTMGTPRR